DFADRFDQMGAENLQDHYALDLDFHTFLMGITQNQRLIRVHREIMIHTQRLSRHAVKPGAVQVEQDRPEHLAIITALLAGDPPRARQALISHINQSLVTALRALRGIVTDEQSSAD
ncbi:MAG: FCD domain-containing protein, partial [Brooklawnia sp.]|nr:FCD domain-containing protein [Brooklawnia sp.]